MRKMVIIIEGDEQAEKEVYAALEPKVYDILQGMSIERDTKIVSITTEDILK